MNTMVPKGGFCVYLCGNEEVVITCNLHLYITPILSSYKLSYLKNKFK